MRLCFYAGVISAAMTATQAVKLDSTEDFMKAMEHAQSHTEEVNETIHKMLKPSKSERMPSKLSKSAAKNASILNKSPAELAKTTKQQEKVEKKEAVKAAAKVEQPVTATATVEKKPEVVKKPVEIATKPVEVEKKAVSEPVTVDPAKIKAIVD